MKKWKKLLAGLFAIAIMATSAMSILEAEAANLPKKTKIISLKSKTAGKVTVKYSKVKGCKYQIQAATNSKMTKGKKSFKTTATTKTISLTKGKKYYIRVRTYKKSGKKTKYSKWSAKTAVTVKTASVKKECDHKWKTTYREMHAIYQSVAGCNGCGYALFERKSQNQRQIAVSFEDLFSHPKYHLNDTIHSREYDCTGGGWHSESYLMGYCTYCHEPVAYRRCNWNWSDAPYGTNKCTRNQANGKYVKTICEPYLQLVYEGDRPTGEYEKAYTFVGYYQICKCGKNEVLMTDKWHCKVEVSRYCSHCGLKMLNGK